jgi:LysM repeat protein
LLIQVKPNLGATSEKEYFVMGFMDKAGGLFGGDKPAEADTVKGPSSVLREIGIDPSNLKFSFNQDGSVAISGHAANQSECDRICKVVGEISNVSGVQNNIIVATPEPIPEVEEPVVAEETVAEEVTAAEPADEGRTYTVQAGDTLWAIAQEMYGSGNKYMKIFEANTSILDNPDKIFPGQKLVIPDIEE